MKIHNDFTLFWRVVPSGKRVIYYYVYDENGKRLYGKSTGETTMTVARVKCNRLMKDGNLIPKKITRLLLRNTRRAGGSGRLART